MISFYKKNNKMICIQWFGLSDEDFKIFLKKYNWDANIIDFYINNDTSHIEKEISINFEIKNNELIPVRTSFYGVI